MSKETSQQMLAVVVRAPEQYGLEKVDIPEVPERGMLLKVRACALCGSDLRTLRNGHRKVEFPWIIGHEIFGTVVELGENYEGRWQIGDHLAVGPLVYCGTCEFCHEGSFEYCDQYKEIAQAWQGGFAEFIPIPYEAVRLGTIARVPAGIDPAYAAAVEPASSCVNALEKGQVGLGDTVVVIGAGPIGCIHTVLARLRGARKVFIADIVPERLKLAEAFSPDQVINAQQIDLVKKVHQLTGGKGADVVITANPIPSTQVQAVEMARKGGRILIFGGLPVGQSRPGIDMNLVHYNALQLIGTTIFAPRHQRVAMDLIIDGKIPVEKLITRFTLDQFVEGAKQALDGKIIKAVFLNEIK